MTTESMSPASTPSVETGYSPHRRTALVLNGTGTAGAYHAGVVRALHEAGVKVDLVAGRDIGVVGAAFMSVDGAERLWASGGLWDGSSSQRLYGWRTALRMAAWVLAVTLAVVLLPMVGVVVAAAVYPVAYLLRVLGVGGDVWLTMGFGQFIEWVFSPTILPTWLPRVVVLGLVVLLGVLAVAAVRVWMRGGRRRRTRSGFWWALAGTPLDVLTARGWLADGLWKLMRGAASIARPGPTDLGQRFTDLLKENLGQPGFRELLVVAHDLDARRDLVFSLLGAGYDRPGAEPEDRVLERVDLAGEAQRHGFDALAAALSLPALTEPWPVRFGSRTVWRGETHRLCDRPGSIGRVLEEVARAGAEQVIFVSALAPPAGPRQLAPTRRDGRGRLGETLATLEATAERDALLARRSHFKAAFEIRPVHNPVGPFDFGGCYDPRSDRMHTLAELQERGYDDGHQQFVGPVVGASGERIESAATSRP